MTRTGQRAPKLKFFRGSTHGNTRRVSKEQRSCGQMWKKLCGHVVKGHVVKGQMLCG